MVIIPSVCLGDFSSYFQGEKVKEKLFVLSVKQYMFFFSKPYPDIRGKKYKNKIKVASFPTSWDGLSGWLGFHYFLNGALRVLFRMIDYVFFFNKKSVAMNYFWEMLA